MAVLRETHKIVLSNKRDSMLKRSKQTHTYHNKSTTQTEQCNNYDIDNVNFNIIVAWPPPIPTGQGGEEGKEARQAKGKGEQEEGEGRSGEEESSAKGDGRIEGGGKGEESCGEEKAMGVREKLLQKSLQKDGGSHKRQNKGPMPTCNGGGSLRAASIHMGRKKERKGRGKGHKSQEEEGEGGMAGESQNKEVTNKPYTPSPCGGGLFKHFLWHHNKNINENDTWCLPADEDANEDKAPIKGSPMKQRRGAS